MKKLFTIVFLCVCLFKVTFASEQNTFTGNRTPLKIVLEDKFPPFSFIDDEGKPAGFTVELITELSKETGLQIKLSLSPRSDLLNTSEMEKYDIVGGVDKNNVAYGNANYSTPFIILENSIFIREGEHNPEFKYDIANREIIVVDKSEIYYELHKSGVSKSIIPVASTEEALILLASGKHNCAILCSQPAQSVIIKKMLVNIKPSAKPFSLSHHSFVIKNGDTSLVNRINGGLALLYANGVYNRLYNKWLADGYQGGSKETVLLHYLLSIIILLLLTIGYFVSRLLINKKKIEKKTSELQRELTDRVRIQNILSEQEDLLKQATKIAKLGNWIWDSNANVLICSSEVFNILGIEEHNETLSSEDFYLSVYTDDRDILKQSVQKAFLQRENFESEFRVLLADGEMKYIRAKAEFSFDNEETLRMTGVLQDVTEYKIAILKIEHSNRLYSYLSQVNEAIVQFTNINKLYNSICRLGIEYGKFDLVWVGLVDEQSGWVKVESFAGKDGDFMTNQKFSVNDNSFGQGAFGLAYRNNSFSFINDLSRSNIHEYAKGEALKRGFRSVASFVLRREDKKIGTISFLSKELNFFTDTEIKLLEEIADNISFAIDNVEKENVRKITRRALQESQEKYLSVFNAVSDPIFLIDWGSGSILDANTAAGRLYGYTHDELLSLKIMDISAEPAETADTLLEHIEIITNRFHKRKDGSNFPVEITATYFIQNNRKFAVTVIRDLTETIKSREKLMESEKRYSSLFQKNRAVMIMFEAGTGCFVDVNPAACQYYGYTKEQFLNLTIADINVMPTEKCFDEIEKVTNNRSSHLFMQHRLSSGEIREVEAFTGLLNILDKQVYYSIIYDITERRKAELELIQAKEKAEEASRLKTSLLGNMSHELRTPLTGILGFSQILNEEITDEFLREMVDKIIRSGKRLMSTLNSILNISELESSKLDVNLAELNLAYSVKERLYEFEKLAVEKNLKFNFLPLDKNVFIYSDENFLNQIIDSLVDNAIKYTEFGGVDIIIDSERDDGKFWGVMRVCDSGIGIPPHLHELIFEEFRQASEGFNRSFEGSGLGLTLAKKMITLLGGTIELESDLGKGSIFTVKLPGYIEIAGKEANNVVADLEINDKIGTISAEMEYMADIKIKEENLPLLLLVEDNFINSDVTIMFLKGICNVDHSVDGENALHMASSNQYDAILMDINLGGKMNGIEVLHELRNIPGYSNVPVIALTGYAMSGDKDRLLKEGFNAYMPKPFDKEDIINLVKIILKK